MTAPAATASPTNHPHEARAGGAWLQLANGVPFALVGPATPLSIETIAAQLARLNRFAGATRQPYSVAQHSVLVATAACAAAGPVAGLAGLLHDAHEIAVSDVPRPTKQALGPLALARLRRLEADVDARIRAGLALMHPSFGAIRAADPVEATAVKWADDTALATEARDLLVPCAWPWLPLPAPWPARIVPADWRAAEAAFVDQWEQLIGLAGVLP